MTDNADMASDPDLLDPPAPDEQRAALLHIIGYRQLRRTIRSSGTGTLFWGTLLLAIWYLGFAQFGKALTILGLIHLGLALAEFLTGLCKKLYPVPETFLMEAGVFLAFAGANAYRQWDQMQKGGRLSAWGVGFALYMLIAAYGRVREYIELQRTPFRRPSSDQLRWFDELMAETRSADPEMDANSLDLPTDPPMRVKFLGDTALVLTPADDDPAVIARNGFFIDREATDLSSREFTGHLSIGGEDAGSFPLDEYNWRNYATWKTAGGDPPPPPRPASSLSKSDT